MADETTDGAQEAPKQPTKGKGFKKLGIIAACAILVLGIGGFFGYRMMSGGKGKTAEKEEKGKHETKGSLVAVEPFVVNLAESGRYLKVTMQLETSDAAEQKLVEAKMPNIRDAVITLLSSKSAESVAGPEGKIQLKDDILLRVNQAVGKDVFKNVYFTDFVMQ